MSVITTLLPKTVRDVGTCFGEAHAFAEDAAGTLEVLLHLSGDDLKDPDVSIVFGIEIFRAGEWRPDAIATFRGGPANTEQPGFFVAVSGYAGKTIRARLTTGKRLSAVSLTAEY